MMRRAGQLLLAILGGLLVSIAVGTLVIRTHPPAVLALIIYGLFPLVLLTWAIIRRMRHNTPTVRWLLTFAIAWTAFALALFILFMALVILALKSFT